MGDEARTTVQTLTFDDEDAVGSWQQLREAYPDAGIYLSGTVTVDYPEDIRLVNHADMYQIVTLSGTSVKLDYCEIERAGPTALLTQDAVLREQYVIGSLTAKIIQPLPNF